MSNYFTLHFVTCGMEPMHGDRVAGTKLTWTKAFVTLPCHMAPIIWPIILLNSWTWKVMHFIQEFVQ